MTRFMTDLILYYACAMAAEQAPVPGNDAMRCSLAYERVKTHFYAAPPAPEGTPERARQSNAAFSALRDWEAANPGKVDDLTDIARSWTVGAPA
jgi:hypothetical protein